MTLDNNGASVSPPALMTETARSTNKKIGVALSAFGLVHAGTIRFLSNARARCDILFAAILPDGELPQENRQAATLLRPDERLRILNEIETVNGGAFSFDPAAARVWRDAAPQALWFFDPPENDITPATLEALEKQGVRPEPVSGDGTSVCTTQALLKRIAK